MKKLRSTIAVMIVICSLLTTNITALAFGPNETRSIDNFFIEAQLLKGTGTDYGLENTANRMEGIVVLIRLMGKEAEAQAMADQPCQFTDVPDWAKGYVNYAYSENLSKGISETKFGVNNNMTADQYNTLLLRVLGYDDSKGDFFWEDSVGKARELSILSHDMAHEYLKTGYVYTKGDLMDTAFCYLEAKYKDQEQTLLDRLIEDGVITEDLAKEYGLSVDQFDTFTTNLSGSEYYSFSIDDEVMTIGGQSEDVDKKWLAVEILDKKTGAERSAKYVSRDSRGTYNIPVSVANLPKGEYYVNLYGNNEKYNTYHGIVNDEVILKVTSKGAYFAPAPEYGQYLRIAKGYQVEPDDTKISLETRADKDALEQIEALSAEITQGCTSDYDKIHAVHDWVAKNIYYDMDYIDEKTYSTNVLPASVASERYAVCVGYSTLTKDLLAAAGVPCKIVYGFALGESGESAWSEVDVENLNGNHAWNIAYAEGRWIALDTTWDSTNVYEDGKFNSGDKYRQLYFDSSLQYFSDSHIEIE